MNIGDYQRIIERARNKIGLFKKELRKEMIWFAFENNKIRSNRYDLPDENDYQILKIDEIIQQKLANDTDMIELNNVLKIYDNYVKNHFPIPLLNDSITLNRNINIGSETIKSIKDDILHLPQKKAYPIKYCQVCEGRGMLVGCKNCGRGKFAIEKNEIGEEICSYCNKNENSRRSIDLIRCVACNGSGKINHYTVR